MSHVAIFVGPSVAAGDVTAAWTAVDVELRLLPPVSQGDVASLARRRPMAIGIIDGYFDRVPAVWHKEILWAMSQGIHVMGAASMGALRAAELASFGMVGVGAVFEAFHSNHLTDDDEVAVAHGGPEDGFRALSVALVDLRATLGAARQDGVIDGEAEEQWLRHAKSLFYPRRNYEALLAWGKQRFKAQAEALEAWLTDGRVAQKRQDALEMVRSLAALAASDPAPKEVRFFFNATSSWRDLERSLLEQRPLDGRAGAETLPEGALIDELRLLGAPYRRLRDAALRRLLALEVADMHRLETGRDAVSKGRRLDALRQRLRLTDDDAWERWLADQASSAEVLGRIVGDDIRVKKVEAYAADHIEGQLLDMLRRRGELGALRRRARRKEEILAQQGFSRVELHEAGPGDEALWAWYFQEHLKVPAPADLAAYAKAHDFSDVNELRWTILREYLLQSSSDDEIVAVTVSLDD